MSVPAGGTTGKSHFMEYLKIEVLCLRLWEWIDIALIIVNNYEMRKNQHEWKHWVTG